MKNVKTIVSIGGLVAVTGLALLSIKKRKKVTGFEVKDYVIGDFDDVKEVLETLNGNVEEFTVVSVADYYDTIGEASSYKDHAYGWTAKLIKKIKVVETYRGWVIKFPPVEEL